MTWEPSVGLHPGVPEATYHSHPDSLSVTGAKTLLKSPAKFNHHRQHPVRKAVFDFGHAAHAKVLGSGADLVIFEVPEGVKSPKSTKAWKEKDAEVHASGGVLLLPEEHDRVCQMADALGKHSTATALLSNGQPEVSAYMTDPHARIMRRGRFDWLNADMLVDYKTTANDDYTSFGTTAAKFGYDMQAVWYLDLARANDLDPRGFVFVVQEKEPPYEVACIQLDPEQIEGAANLIATACERFRDCTEAGVWPSAAPDQIISATVPGWRLNQYYKEIA